MKVIVAGMSKTGTKTMNEALTLLGYKVYDVLENTWYFRDEWLDILRNGAKIAELQRMYKDVDAVCDVPCLFYWEELLEAFPDAKVILTTRDEDSWYTSLKKQFKSLSSDYGFKLLFCLTLVGWRLLPVRNANFALLGNRGNWPWSNYNTYDEEVAKRMYRKHNRNVLKNVPENQLLVFNVKQGWKPLCNFLRHDIPDFSFPHKNKGASVAAEMRKENKIMQRLDKELHLSLAIIFIVFAFFLYQLLVRWLWVAL